MSQEQHHDEIVPYLCVKGAEKAIAFYQTVFGASEVSRYQEDDGRVGHATLDIHGAEIFLSDEFPEINVKSPETIGGSAVTVYILLADVDVATKRAVDAGAKLVREPGDQPFGERISKIVDPFGHSWMIASKIP